MPRFGVVGLLGLSLRLPVVGMTGAEVVECIGGGLEEDGSTGRSEVERGG